TTSQPPERACKTSKHYRSRLARPPFFRACTRRSRLFGNRWLPQTTWCELLASSSGDFLTASPPGEKATACQDQAGQPRPDNGTGDAGRFKGAGKNDRPGQIIRNIYHRPIELVRWALEKPGNQRDWRRSGEHLIARRAGKGRNGGCGNQSDFYDNSPANILLKEDSSIANRTERKARPRYRAARLNAEARQHVCNRIVIKKPCYRLGARVSFHVPQIPLHNRGVSRRRRDEQRDEGR